MKTARLSVSVLFAVALASCSQVPRLETIDAPAEPLVKAAGHWDVIADDVVAQTTAALRQMPPGAARPLYVAPAQSDSAFSKGFRNFLISRMVNRGLPVTTNRGGAIELTYETQVARHNSKVPAYKPGMLSVLTAGVLVVRGIALDDAGEVAALASAAVADGAIAEWQLRPPRSELIVTSSIVVDERYVMRKSDTYYIEAADASLYGESPDLKEWRVVK